MIFAAIDPGAVMIKRLITVALLIGTIAPAQAWTCLPVKSRPTIALSVDVPTPIKSVSVDYSPETGWTIISHYPGGQIKDWHDYAVIENIDGSQWRGVPTGKHPPKEGWWATGKLYLGEDGVMNYTYQAYEPSGKLRRQFDFKCYKELIS